MMSLIKNIKHSVKKYEYIKQQIEDLKSTITKELLMRRRFYALKAFIDTDYKDLSIIKKLLRFNLSPG